MHISTLQKRRGPLELFSDINTPQFASVTVIVVFVLLLLCMTAPTYHHGFSADLPKVWHSMSMPDALREDVIRVTITRDGKIYLGTAQIVSADVAVKIQERLQDHGVERKVYVVADMRARWGVVKRVLEGVRSTGILRIAFLVNQRSKSWDSIM
jgi:biopolymer transport protein ExbD